MYPLGKQFEIDTVKSRSDPSCIFQGQNYRISVISERCVRLEYSTNNQFIDNPTQLIKRRNIGKPDFSVQQDNYKVFRAYICKRTSFWCWVSRSC